MSDHEIVLDAKAASDVASIARALPDPATLEPGARVVLRGAPKDAPSLATRLFAALGRGKPQGIPRALRCTALVARGYVDVGADDAGDRVWGRAPDAVTGPC